jgi:hypothetical protein
MERWLALGGPTNRWSRPAARKTGGSSGTRWAGTTENLWHMTRLRVSLKRPAALRADRTLLAGPKLAYVLVADKKLKYETGRSRIVYIGTTKNGKGRVAESVATRASAILTMHGVFGFEARIVTCTARRNVKSWRKLEMALIIVFRERFGEPPKCNDRGRAKRPTDHFTYFSKTRLTTIIEDLS